MAQSYEGEWLLSMKTASEDPEKNIEWWIQKRKKLTGCIQKDECLASTAFLHPITSTCTYLSTKAVMVINVTRQSTILREVARSLWVLEKRFSYSTSSTSPCINVMSQPESSSKGAVDRTIKPAKKKGVTQGKNIGLPTTYEGVWRTEEGNHRLPYRSRYKRKMEPVQRGCKNPPPWKNC